MSTDLKHLTAELTEEQLEAALIQRRKDKEKLKEQKRKDFVLKKEAYVELVVEAFLNFQKSLKQMKQEAIRDGNQIWLEMFDLKDSEPKDQKQFSLTNKDKTLKVTVERAERMGFSEEAIVGIEGVKEYFKEKFANRNKQVYAMLDTLLAKNGAGDYDPKLLSKLRSQVNEINDPVLTQNFKIIEENQVVMGTALYLRAYKKDDMGKLQDITLQFSSL